MRCADLSVVMPNYNHARYLPRALDAILSQSVPAREVLVLDDASTDNSVEVVEAIAKQNPTIKLIRNERNLGVVATMNRGTSLATSRYLLFAAADDYVLPGFFESCLTLLDRHPQAGLCTTFDSAQFGEGGRIELNPSEWGETGYYSPDDVCRVLKHTIPGHATICRRDALLALGGFATELAWYCDWFALVALAFRHGACHVPESLAIRVLMPENYSAEARERERNIAVLGAFFDAITQPASADVAPFFRRNGSATHFGTDLLRAAARRADRWQPAILGLVNGFSEEQYVELLADPDPRVQELASLFLGPFWKKYRAQRQQITDEIVHLNNLLSATRAKLPPPGALGKFRWLATSALRRLAKSH